MSLFVRRSSLLSVLVLLLFTHAYIAPYFMVVAFQISNTSHRFHTAHPNSFYPLENSVNHLRISVSCNMEYSSSYIKNFRQAALLPRIIRCAETDCLADVDDESMNDTGISLITKQTGLILDLRSPSERNEEKASAWMSTSGFQVCDEVEAVGEGNKKVVMRVDVLSPTRLFQYLTENWLTPTERALSAVYFAIDIQKRNALQMDVLNKRGLTGLYEAILQTSGGELFDALKAITIFLERSNNEKINIAVHCVQGKDRTGLLIMLCQYIAGASDLEIIDDYHKSHKVWKNKLTAVGEVERGKLNKNVFAGAPENVMLITLSFIKSTYGSISLYLDHIGFDETWRSRLCKVLMVKDDFKKIVSNL